MSAYPGPRIKPETVTDEQGTYTRWPGMVCMFPGCNVELTSRNRHGTARFCKEHGRARDRAAWHGRGSSRNGGEPALTRQQSSKTTTKANADASDSLAALTPQLRAALGTWLRSPGWSVAVTMMQAALDDYELQWLLKRAIPLTSAPSTLSPLGPIPVSDDFPNNPLHKTTDTLEFLADCDHYGV